ncbi:MAG: nucleotide sugar dehydrogenase, partial [Pseudomonadota bacterium]
MIAHQDRTVSIVGLGYVGLPLALAFARTGRRVIGFDIDETRVAELLRGEDRTGESEPGALAGVDILFTSDPGALRQADFHIVAVPTPIDEARRPDLRPLLAASRTVGAQLKSGDVVVYESTVYPGCTRDECLPVLEAVSGLRLRSASDPDEAQGVFGLGYSPERINPGDKTRPIEKIVKIVSGSDPETSAVVEAVYASVIEAGLHAAPSIETAEAAKVIENTQRDVNIALMNEFALIFPVEDQ